MSTRASACAFEWRGGERARANNWLCRVQFHHFRDKAAGYGIQGAGGALISSIEGDFYTVMGLPLHMFTKRIAASQYF